MPGDLVLGSKATGPTQPGLGAQESTILLRKVPSPYTCRAEPF